MAEQVEIIEVTATDVFVPTDAAATGTVTTKGLAFATSTANQVVAGDYITDIANLQARQVTSVTRDGLRGTLAKAFDTELSALALKKILKDDAKVISLGIAAGSGGIDVNGVTIAEGTSVNYAAPLNGSKFVEPIALSSGGAATVSIERHA